MAEDTSTSGGIPEAGEVIADRYEVEDILGTGGMSLVVGARHVGLGQPVAIKFLFPEMAAKADIVERFLREARAMATIQGDHVPRVYDVANLPNGAPYIVMERLTGSDLEKIARARGPLPIAEAVGWLLEASEAVAAAHASGIVHRDLKTANLFLAKRPDGSAIVKVLDFGISKMAGAKVSLTGAATTLGSPAFISPEQIRSTKSVDHRTDIWAMGVILHRLLTGGYPFDGDRVADTLDKVLTAPPKPPSALRADIPPGLEAAILHCLEKPLDQRTQDAADFALEIAPFGPPEGRASVERVWRALRGTSPPVVVTPAPRAARAPEPTAVMKNPALRVTVPLPVAPPAPDEPTAVLSMGLRGASGPRGARVTAVMGAAEGGPGPATMPMPAAPASVPVVGSVPVAASVPVAPSVPVQGRRWAPVAAAAVVALIAAGLGVSRLAGREKSPPEPLPTIAAKAPAAPTATAEPRGTTAPPPIDPPPPAPDATPSSSPVEPPAATAAPPPAGAPPKPPIHAAPQGKKRNGSYLDKW